MNFYLHFLDMEFSPQKLNSLLLFLTSFHIFLQIFENCYQMLLVKTVFNYDEGRQPYFMENITRGFLEAFMIGSFLDAVKTVLHPFLNPDIEFTCKCTDSILHVDCFICFTELRLSHPKHCQLSYLKRVTLQIKVQKNVDLLFLTFCALIYSKGIFSKIEFTGVSGVISKNIAINASGNIRRGL